MRRWTLRICFVVLALLVVAVASVQAVLMTDLPKRIVLGEIEKQLGLKVSAATLRTGWNGNTAMSNVTLSLPLAEQSFLDVPRMSVRHTSLLKLLITRSVTIDAIELDKPNLAVRRDPAGRWNMADVAELVARAGGKENKTPTGTPSLPAVTITDGTVVVDDAKLGQKQTIPDVNVTGRRDGALVYRYDVKLSDRVSLVGQVAPGAPWKHEVDAELKQVAEWLKPWVKELPDNATVSAQWTGELKGDGKIQGQLAITQAKAGALAANGAIKLRDNGDGSVTAEPEGLKVTTGNPAVPEVMLASGRLTADAKGVRAERMLVSGVGGQARVDGNYALLTSSGELTADWTDLMFPRVGMKNFTGSFKAELATPFPGRPQLKAKLTARGVAPDGPFAASIDVDGNGRSGWGEMDWRLFAEKLDWSGNYPVSFGGGVARVETTHKRDSGTAIIRLLSLEKPNEPLVAGGEVDLATMTWKAWLSAGAIAVPKTEKEMSLSFNAWGNRDYVRIDQFYLRVPRAELWSQGWYVYKDPKPVQLDVLVRNMSPTTPARHDVKFEVASSETPATPPGGSFRADFHLSGTAAAPRDLDLKGKLRASGLKFGTHVVDAIAADLEGHVDNAQAAVTTDRLEMLKGRWNLEARYDAKTRGLTLGAKVADLPADAIAQLVGQKKAEGTVSGQWSVFIPSITAGIDRIGMNGSLVGDNVKAGAFVADRVDARTSIDRGTFYITDIRATRRANREVADGGENGVKVTDGRIDAAAKFAIAKPTLFTVNFLASNWPVRLDTAWVDVNGGSEQMTIDMAAPPETGAADALKAIPRQLAIRGPLSLNAQLLAGRGTEVARAKIDAAFNGRELNLKSVKVEASGGMLSGNAIFDADYPLGSTAAFAWSRVDAVMIADLFPAAAGLGGTYDGTLSIQPAKNKRALEPLTFAIDVRPENGRYRDIEFGQMQFRGYTNLDRIVLADLTDNPSELHVANGVIRLWGRLSAHAATGAAKNVVSTQMTVVLDDLSLDEIVRTGKPDADPMPGRLNGRFTLIGSTRPLREDALVEKEQVPAALERLSKSISASGQIELSRSNLANVDAFTALYNTMALGQDVHTPTGHGTAEVRMEDGALYLNNLRYFNRGTEIRALATVSEIWKLPKSSVEGSAVGNARPFSEVKLPLFGTLDRVLTLAQPSGVEVRGTVENPKVRMTAFDDLGSAIKAFVIGDARAETRK